MKKNAPSIREIEAAKAELFRKGSKRAEKKAGVKPSYEQNQAWCEKHPTPMRRWDIRYHAANKTEIDRVHELLLAARMGQMTSEEFYAAVKAF